MNPIKLARAQETLAIGGSALKVQHEDFDDGGVDTLVSSGAQNWGVPVKCFMQGYGMFVANWLLDLGDYIGFVQLYEHSRGGHTDPSITIVGHDGTTFGRIDRYAGDFEIAAFNDKYLWLLNRDGREYREAGLANFTGSCLMQIELATGTVESETPIQVPEKFFRSQRLTHAWLTTVGLSSLRVKFAEVTGNAVLDISVVNYQRDPKHHYDALQISLADLVS
ncbi:hypothetical protein [Turneriella parva]|uniref:Uncharacterized protein n=1 Tax=Turneriella parva (strain ATCC BAA-1111 / DSM 21527 / NCTC 11395 / H) TaxID=869212 RepID=I4B5S1_TURPD|nr:hypothetical protein [Turneriella parva]AFM12628.1 hypothetical protein Turpa_1981 [Turneriella parva DSM 21527]